MKTNDKLNNLKNTIQELKSISSKLEDNKIYKNKIQELNKEIIRLKKGIIENIDELEEFLGDEDA